MLLPVICTATGWPVKQNASCTVGTKSHQPLSAWHDAGLAAVDHPCSVSGQLIQLSSTAPSVHQQDACLRALLVATQLVLLQVAHAGWKKSDWSVRDSAACTRKKGLSGSDLLVGCRSSMQHGQQLTGF